MFSTFFNRPQPLSSTLSKSKKKCLERALDHEALFRVLTLSFLVFMISIDPALAGLDEDLSQFSSVLKDKILPIGLLGAAAWALITFLGSANIKGIVFTFIGVIIGGYLLNSIISGNFMKILGS